FSYSNGMLLPGSALEQLNIIPATGENRGASDTNRKYVSVVLDAEPGGSKDYAYSAARKYAVIDRNFKQLLKEAKEALKDTEGLAEGERSIARDTREGALRRLQHIRYL